ncbi:hypothetical protein Sjap_020869 [Stephania japonica]|uniref:Uncharacterized protein n=1 Tax=Stephania japonica TaxID=461633 RepID=A0AAP0F1J0_9MAGN
MEVAQNAMAQIPRETKKRKLETIDHGCFNICNLVKELRPHFIEVLRAPDFRNSKAAQEIRQRKFFEVNFELFISCILTGYHITFVLEN